MPSIKRQPSLTTSCCASHCKGVYVSLFLKTLLRMNDTDTRKKKNSKTVIGSLTKRQIWNIQSRLQMIGVGRCFANSFRQLQGGSRVWSSHRLNTSTIMHTETRLYMQETERQRQTNTVTHTHTQRGMLLSHTARKLTLSTSHSSWCIALKPVEYDFRVFRFLQWAVDPVLKRLVNQSNPSLF